MDLENLKLSYTAQVEKIAEAARTDPYGAAELAAEIVIEHVAQLDSLARAGDGGKYAMIVIGRVVPRLARDVPRLRDLMTSEVVDIASRVNPAPIELYRLTAQNSYLTTTLSIGDSWMLSILVKAAPNELVNWYGGDHQTRPDPKKVFENWAQIVEFRRGLSDFINAGYLKSALFKEYQRICQLIGSQTSRTELTSQRRSPPTQSASLRPLESEQVARDPALDARDKWLYQQCIRLVPYSKIRIQLRSKPKKWPRLESVGGIKSAASKYAERERLPTIPKRQQGRRSQN